MEGCRIKLVSRQKFYHLKQKHQMHAIGDNAIYPWKAKNILRLRDKGYTDNIVNCNGGGVTNGKRVTLFHLDPDETKSSAEKKAIHDTLTSDVFELCKEAPVRGFIAGGRAYKMQADEDSDNEGSSVNSKRLHGSLEKLISKAGIGDISQIWGRRDEALDGYTNLLYNPKKNTWYVNVQIDDDDEIGRDVLTLDDLRNTFDTIHLAKGDVLETPEGTFTHRDVNYPSLNKLGNVFKNAFGKSSRPNFFKDARQKTMVAVES